MSCHLAAMNIYACLEGFLEDSTRLRDFVAARLLLAIKLWTCSLVNVPAAARLFQKTSREIRVFFKRFRDLVAGRRELSARIMLALSSRDFRASRILTLINRHELRAVLHVFRIEERIRTNLSKLRKLNVLVMFLFFLKNFVTLRI